jgi:CRISPR/Cas system-associated exonuclease Cas4 (RecB family)
MPKRAAAAIRDGRSHSYLGIAGAVERQVRDHKKAEARGTLLEELKAEGCKLIDRPRDTFRAKEQPLSRSEYRGLGLPKGKHAKEPCHAAWIDDSYYDDTKIKRVYICTDPKRHTAKGASSLKLPKPEKGGQPDRDARLSNEERERRAKVKAEREALAVQTERRRAFVKDLIENLRGKKIGKDEILAFVARFLATYEGFMLEEGQAEAAVLCGIVDAEQTIDDNAVESFLARSSSALHRFALATALCAYENDLQITRSAIQYWEFLERHGYEISELERATYQGAA